jgi:hypothetical protein
MCNEFPLISWKESLLTTRKRLNESHGTSGYDNEEKELKDLVVHPL